MKTEEGRRQLMDTSSLIEEEAGYDFASVSKRQESSVIVEDAAAAVEDDESAVIVRGHRPEDTVSFSSRDVQNFSKPTLSYVALIAKVILSSPSEKLSLGSIYREMEERFPHLGTRGPGWRNSVRHNLSVNDCFVKVSRCEDGRGHYWGVHQAHLRDFQHGNFKQHRNTRGKRERERDDSAARRLALTETGCLLGQFPESRSGTPSWVRPQCPLQDPGRNMNFLYWVPPCSQPWDVSLGPLQPPCWVGHHCFPEGPPDSYSKAAAGHHLTSNHHRGDVKEPVCDPTASCDGRLITPGRALWFPCWWCTCPGVKDLTNPLV